jgi:hypothetical protein
MRDSESINSQARMLSQMMDLEAASDALWKVDELEAILLHQLEASLETDLTTIDASVAERLRGPAASKDQPIGSFRNLLWHARPPVELLDLTKRYAKRCRTQPESPLPKEIATALYYLAIAVARVKSDRPISTLDDQKIRQGLEWAVEQTWLDRTTRELVTEMIRTLEAGD